MIDLFTEDDATRRQINVFLPISIKYVTFVAAAYGLPALVSYMLRAILPISKDLA